MVLTRFGKGGLRLYCFLRSPARWTSIGTSSGRCRSDIGMPDPLICTCGVVDIEVEIVFEDHVTPEIERIMQEWEQSSM